MCGFAGFCNAQRTAERSELETRAIRMANTLRHRGPDSCGVWAYPEGGIAFGHRRLSIVDLSPAGHQPMCSRTGRYVLVYNGEIYNCEELRQHLVDEIPELRFRGHSDTEVMLAAFEYWGIEASLNRMNGMFAFAVWDHHERELLLARDRFGEKPVYYGLVKGTFLFASELKAFRAHPEFDAEIDRDALACYLRFNCIPGALSIYKGVSKLLPGNLLRLKNGQIKISNFWSLRSCVERATAEPFRGSIEDAEKELDSLLRDAVKLRMHADVPLGAFLSGGIDSSLVVALMQTQSRTRVRTFSIGLHGDEYDEANDARRVAAHLGTEHTEFYVTPADAMQMLDRLPEIYDEPFADSSQIPTLLVSQLARRHVTVSLSGDGGDEVFGGYNRYTWGGTVWNRLQHTPRPLRRLLASALTIPSPQTWNAAFRCVGPMVPPSWRQRVPGYKLHKLAGLVTSADQMDMYNRMASHWLEPERTVYGAEPRDPLRIVEDQWMAFPDFEQQAMYLDTITYLPNDILVKVDRATMAFSLEGRIPYLDHRVVEFAWRLPLEMKVRPKQGKWILRKLLRRYVPSALVERPKAGFGIPLDAWLRGPLRKWAESLLETKALDQQGFFRAAPIRQMWTEHLSGRGAWQYHLWDILMFQLWLRDQDTRVADQSQSIQQMPVSRFAEIQGAAKL